jgi:hypothetical protein
MITWEAEANLKEIKIGEAKATLGSIITMVIYRKSSTTMIFVSGYMKDT